MITRARVISQNTQNSSMWNVHIPILDGLPNSFDEYKEYKENNITKANLEDMSAADKYKAAKVAKAGNANKVAPLVPGKTLDEALAKRADYTGLESYTHAAYVCGLPGLSNSIQIDDIVYVGFEDNDMGKPIILGHLLTQELEIARSDFPKLIVEDIEINNSNNNQVLSENSVKAKLNKLQDSYNSFNRNLTNIATFAGQNISPKDEAAE